VAEDKETTGRVPDRSALTWLLVRMTAYYAVIAVILLILSALSPGILDDLPVGGVGSIMGDAPAIRELEDALLSGDQEVVDTIVSRTGNYDSRFAEAKTLIIAMFGTIMLMLPVSWMYKAIHVKGIYDHSLDETALILPAVVAGIVLIVQHSLALAFSLAGIVAGVRFRRALSDTFDTLFIFVAIGVGIAAGVKALEISAVMTVFFNYATICVCLFGDGLESHYLANEKLLKIAKKRRAQAAQEAAAAEAKKTEN